jgi:hypothetical protein
MRLWVGEKLSAWSLSARAGSSQPVRLKPDSTTEVRLKLSAKYHAVIYFMATPCGRAGPVAKAVLKSTSKRESSAR